MAVVLKSFIVAPAAGRPESRKAPPVVSAAQGAAPRAGCEKVGFGFSRKSRPKY
jgi:hypothetical protein